MTNYFLMKIMNLLKSVFGFDSGKEAKYGVIKAIPNKKTSSFWTPIYGIYTRVSRLHYIITLSTIKQPKKSIVLQSNFIPFKSITLKGILKIIIFSIIIFYTKSFIYPILIKHITDNLLQIHIIYSIIAFLMGSLLNEAFDYIIKDITLDSFKNVNVFNPNKDLINNMKRGESSKMGESSKAGESPTGESSKRRRIITDSDYESGSDSSTKNFHPYSDQHYTEDTETKGSKLVNSNLPEFKETLESLTNEEIVETMDIIDTMKEEYKKSNVPSAKAQIQNLNIKENLCASQLEENLTDVDSKGKGKEVATSNEKDKDSKGKGKEVDRTDMRK